jgi:hypothetical protein
MYPYFCSLNNKWPPNFSLPFQDFLQFSPFFPLNLKKHKNTQKKKKRKKKKEKEKKDSTSKINYQKG